MESAQQWGGKGRTRQAEGKNSTSDLLMAPLVSSSGSLAARRVRRSECAAARATACAFSGATCVHATSTTR